MVRSVLFFGLLGEGSQRPLTALLQAGVPVTGIVVPLPRQTAASPIELLEPEPVVSELTLVNRYANRTILHIGWERNIPVWGVRALQHPQTLAVLTTLQPDLACVACFSRRIPPALLLLPPLGFLNVHPSLLPAYRGPEPLFWQFRQGEPNVGVTVHRLDEGLDTGDVVGQRPLTFPDGISGPDAERLWATVGGELLVAAVHQLAAGTAVCWPQQGTASYYPAPSETDFELLLEWSAQRAFNFMRGVTEWQRPFFVAAAGERLWGKTAVAYDPTARLSAPFIRQGQTLVIQFSPGTLQIQ